MQVNSAQDYLTAQKRRVIAASFVSAPPPLNRRYNYVYTARVANSETRYNKLPYPQNLSLAAGSRPGLPYAVPGVRDTVSDCANCPT